METMMVHCPGCDALLRVPRDASGRLARCPSCKSVVRIPQPEELYEETASCWIEESVITEERDRVARIEQRVTELGGQQRGRRSGLRADDDELAAHDLGESSILPSPVATDRSMPVAPPDQSDAAADKADEDEARETQASTGPVHGDGPLPRDEQESRYPTDLFSHDRPLLAVTEVTNNGITLAFDSEWLADARFRASMPMRCAFTGESNREKLLGRPLAFVDCALSQAGTVQEVEGRLEQPVGADSPGAFARRLGMIDALPYPFNHAMPYYVSREHDRHSITPHTRRREDGGHTCEVHIGDLRTALQWLANVNGICGEEYALLEADIAELERDAWRTLPETIRRRIGVWCRFEPREQFAVYIPDADFTTSDAGLAGLVVTSRRMVYHKYHHSGHWRFGPQAMLHITKSDRFARLALEHDGERSKCCRIPLDEINRLISALHDAPGIQVTISK